MLCFSQIAMQNYRKCLGVANILTNFIQVFDFTIVVHPLISTEVSFFTKNRAIFVNQYRWEVVSLHCDSAYKGITSRE